MNEVVIIKGYVVNRVCRYFSGGSLEIPSIVHFTRKKFKIEMYFQCFIYFIYVINFLLKS